MSYKNPEIQRTYNREWMRKRRAMFKIGRICAHCGKTGKLDIHHIDPSTKVSHRIWSWSIVRIEEELRKCVYLCKSCHVSIHGSTISLAIRGTHNGQSKLTNDKVYEIRLLLARHVPKAHIARQYAISRRTVRRIETGECWGWLQ